jgi:hypothetical protein
VHCVHIDLDSTASVPSELKYFFRELQLEPMFVPPTPEHVRVQTPPRYEAYQSNSSKITQVDILRYRTGISRSHLTGAVPVSGYHLSGDATAVARKISVFH